MAKAEREVQSLWYVFVSINHLVCLSLPKWCIAALCTILVSEIVCSSFLFSAGQVQFAEIKMENGKSKGCGTVRFDSPESAEKACRMMNGTKINGREVDVRIDRNA